MPSIAVVGLQWGDEGKGKVVDFLADFALYVVRSQGGHNAMHTVKVQDDELQLHCIPAGICRKNAICYIAGGCVIDPGKFLEEITMLQEKNIDYQNRVFISPYAHVIFPYHYIIDEKEAHQRKNEVKEKGIGPCYVDKIRRFGLRVANLMHASFKEKLQDILQWKNQELQAIYHHEPLDFEKIYTQYQQYQQLLLPFVCDQEITIADAVDRGDPVIFEGAQGSLLDLTYGSYPYVSSSSTVAAGLCAGCGAGPTRIDHTLGVIKAYVSHIGKGPFPTRLQEKDKHIFPDTQACREVGDNKEEIRQIGWFDAVLAKHAIRLNGVDSLAITKIDVLDELETIKICIGYKVGKEEIYSPSILWEDMYSAIPIYEEIEGWKMSTSNITSVEDLPPQAKHFLDRLRHYCGVPITMISLGPEREQTIMKSQFFV